MRVFPEFEPYLEKRVESLVGISLTGRQLRQFSRFGEMLVAWNEKINLTAITEPQEIIVKHFIDSLTLQAFLLPGALVDVGTGAGFPGLPLKIAMPELQVVLVDALGKRLEFIKEVIAELGLEGVETVHARAEELGRREGYREKFANVASRAVARLPVLLEYLLPLARVGGVCLAAKGSQAEQEVRESERALRVLGGQIREVAQFRLSDAAEHRSVVVISKLAPTPVGYPRRAGTPEKKPLV